MRTIAMYLPQFHRIPENDQWWGEGYTEWTAVKGAKPLFEGHYQPHVPLDNNYYDLTNPETLRWQAGLMKTYQIDGMCFYHYYFKNSKMVLEKPAELLLENKDIEMPFCFSWANESWVRTWSRISGTSWNIQETEDEKKDEKSGILLLQEYGDEQEWKRHFRYLEKFFSDVRYIKKNNQPVFLIYEPDDIACLTDMMICWNTMAKECGLNKIYYIGVNTTRSGFDAYMTQQPAFSCSLVKKGKMLEPYHEACDEIVRDAVCANEKTYLCGMVSFDDSPRRGKNGSVTNDVTPELFYEQMKKLYYLSNKQEKDFLFVNAWNEWGEGMHLEPDEKYKYGFLEAIKKAQKDYAREKEIDIYDIRDQRVYDRKEKGELEKNIQKLRSHYHLVSKWLTIWEENGRLLPYFQNHQLKTVAVYGIGKLGKHLLWELERIGIYVKYGIDSKPHSFKGLKVYSLVDALPTVDAIIVTPVDEFDDICNDLKNITDNKIISLEEVINYCLAEL